jgi:hypothetical protein
MNNEARSINCWPHVSLALTLFVLLCGSVAVALDVCDSDIAFFLLFDGRGVLPWHKSIAGAA